MLYDSLPKILWGTISVGGNIYCQYDLWVFIDRIGGLIYKLNLNLSSVTDYIVF